MLTYAFDLLYAIYEEQGYQATDIPRLILENNLYGIEIDQRAGALASFALTMKAREKDRRYFTRNSIQYPEAQIQYPNVCVLENIQIDPEDLSAYMDKVGRDLFSGGLQGVVNQWEEADNFGSLIRPLVTDVSEVLELLRERQMGEDLFLAGVHQKVLKALRQADYLSPKYHVVVANPPYMGGRNMCPSVKEFLRKRYASTQTDTFASFVVRNLELTLERGQLGFMTPFVWMFISSHEDLRRTIIDGHSIVSLVQLEYSGFDGATVPICTFTLEKKGRQAAAGAYIRLSDFRGAANQAPRTLEAIRNPDCGWFYRAKTSDFGKIPGAPIAYWVSDRVREIFSQCDRLDSISPTKKGMDTADNDRFLRLWHEVADGNIGFNCESNEASIESGCKWFPYKKGGSYRKWYGNNEYVLNWHNGGKEVSEWGRASIRSKQLFFRSSITWTATSSSYFGVRHCDSGFISDAKGSATYASEENHYWILAMLASKQIDSFLRILNPTIEYQAGNIATLPLPLSLGDGSHPAEDLSDIGKTAVAISRDDWDAYEVSWDFTQNPLIKDSGLVESAYLIWIVFMQSQVSDLRSLERENNRIFNDVYELGDEFDASVPIESVTLNSNPAYRYGSSKSESELEALLLADTMREFISYAVGCMLGRYSLDKPGLILANQGETADDYRQQIPEPTFAPDDDNVIPLLDGDWFTDDISERFKEFLKVTFGTEHYEENLTFLENSLYPDNKNGKKRKTIRDYFLKSFYDHHIKLYKKRPIYWLFSSPKGTFNALIYMHRYREDTVSVILNDYLREFQTKLASKSDHLQSVANSADSSKTEKAKAIKEMNKLNKQLKELEDYERDIIYPLATQQIEIDLDDGVKVNFNKFGTALKKVTGLTGKG